MCYPRDVPWLLSCTSQTPCLACSGAGPASLLRGCDRRRRRPVDHPSPPPRHDSAPFSIVHQAPLPHAAQCYRQSFISRSPAASFLATSSIAVHAPPAVAVAVAVAPSSPPNLTKAVRSTGNHRHFCCLSGAHTPAPAATTSRRVLTNVQRALHSALRAGCSCRTLAWGPSTADPTRALFSSAIRPAVRSQ